MNEHKSQPKRNPAVTVEALRLRHTRQAHNVFEDALLHHFAYFDMDYKQRVLADNSLGRMVRAVLRPSRIILVARDQGRIIGYVIGSAPRDGNAQVYWLFVKPEYRGQNVGLMLLSRALKQMTAKGAHTATLITHDHAKYYARQGFRLIKTMPAGGTMNYILSYDLRRSK
jgi:ribosomal protein S18 acetylase RimI-like enzyme